MSAPLLRCTALLLPMRRTAALALGLVAWLAVGTPAWAGNCRFLALANTQTCAVPAGGNGAKVEVNDLPLGLNVAGLTLTASVGRGGTKGISGSTTGIWPEAANELTTKVS